MKGRRVVVLALVALLAAALACSGGGSSHSFVTSRSSSGDSGRIEMKGSANGTVSDEIEIAQNFPGATVDLEAVASVDSGQYTIEFLDDSGYSVLGLDAVPGAPSRGTVTVVLNDDGAVPYALTASDAEGVQIVISFKIQ